MATDSQIMPKDCQCPSVLNGSTELGFRHKLRRWLLRLLSAAERRIHRFRKRLGAAVPGETEVPGAIREAISHPGELNDPPSKPESVPGEYVEVLSYEEIARTLDDGGMCDGLVFMEGMKRYCGRKMRLFKKIRAIFDERQRKMLAIRRPRYLLENAICDGVGQYDKEGCDRCCFYFWSNRWLRFLN